MNRSFKRLAIVPGGLPHSRTRPQQNHIVSKEKAQNPDRNLFTSALRSGNDGRLGPPEPIFEADGPRTFEPLILSGLYNQ